MVKKAPSLHAPMPGPLPDGETLYVGVDVGKQSHVAALVSTSLLRIHKDWQHTPTLTFARSVDGFAALRATIEQYASLERCTVLFESTGPYSRAIEQYLLELGVTLYRKHVRVRPDRLVKTDKRDAQALASHAYNVIERGQLPTERAEEIRRVISDTPLAARLRPLVQHRYELAEQNTRIQNRLTSILDETFPEFVQLIKQPNAKIALSIRDHFPSVASLVSATLDEMRACKVQISQHIARPADEKLLQLQTLARASVGSHDAPRLASLATEQHNLIVQLRLIEAQQKAIEAEIGSIVTTSREGQILMSIPPIGVIPAATLIAYIGSINKFGSAAKLRSYCGWAPKRVQTGNSLDSTTLARSGNMRLKQMLYLVALLAVQEKNHTTWRETYLRLVARKCQQDATGEYHGKLRVIGDICGRIVGVVYALLRQDADVLANLQPGEDIPPPILYSREIHTAATHE